MPFQVLIRGVAPDHVLDDVPPRRHLSIADALLVLESHGVAPVHPPRLAASEGPLVPAVALGGASVRNSVLIERPLPSGVRAGHGSGDHTAFRRKPEPDPVGPRGHLVRVDGMVAEVEVPLPANVTLELVLVLVKNGGGRRRNVGFVDAAI